jgi:uncharacterized membrane protein
MKAQIFALLTAVAFASSNVAVKRGFSFTTPLTATVVSLAIHSAVLWIAVFVTGGIPTVATAAIVAIAITGVLQPGIRHFHYTGIHKIGTSRAVTLRNSYPFLTVIAGIVFLGEPLTLLGMAGTLLVVAGIILTSWRMDRNLPSFRWVYLFYPIATVLLTTIVHPLRRYALMQSHEPLLLAALVGPIALLSFAAFYASPACTDKLVWDRRAFWPLVISGIFETMAVLFMLIAFASGPVYIVSPISATAPIWTMMIGALFLKEVEQISLATIAGTILVVAGVLVISQIK